MKLLIALIALKLFLPSTVLAQEDLFKPLIKINDQLTQPYHISNNSLPEDFILPQSKVPSFYQINQPIDFEIQTGNLPFSVLLLGQIKFLWDFGDGNTGEGLKTNHLYLSPGSFLLKITYQTNDQIKQPLDIVLIHILPDKNYILPEAVISVNNQVVKDPTKINFKQIIKLDGSLSKNGSTQIVNYVWDLGDGEMSTNKIVQHQYWQAHFNVKPILRVIDEKGFFSDTFVEIINDQTKVETGDHKLKSIMENFKPLFLALPLAVLVIILFYFKRLTGGKR